jgi:hypothetical protein
VPSMITVMNTNDTGPGSLRAAITQADMDTTRTGRGLVTRRQVGRPDRRMADVRRGEAVGRERDRGYAG